METEDLTNIRNTKSLPPERWKDPLLFQNDYSTIFLFLFFGSLSFPFDEKEKNVNQRLLHFNVAKVIKDHAE